MKLFVPVFLASSILAVSAFAQSGATSTSSCADHLNTSPDPSVEALLNCLVEMQRSIDQLAARAPVPGPEGAAGPAGPKGDPGDPAFVPAGAVIAFDRPGGCPSGWKDMGTEWRGRAIVAAVPNADDRYGFRRSGGAETHKLAASEIPNHSHSLPISPTTPELSQVGMIHDGNSPFAGRTVALGGAKNLESGGISGGNDHNNMPPYVALYFCKKEGG